MSLSADSRPRGSYDLAVAYRVCPFSSRAPSPLFPDDKFALVRASFDSFCRAVGTLRVKLWLILDRCGPEYEAFFRAHWPAEHLEVVREPASGNGPTFLQQIELLCAQEEAELVALAEDDYVWLPDSLGILVSFLRAHPDADFTTGYDHPANHTEALHAGPREQREFAGRSWFSQVSTTCSFMARRDSLREAVGSFASYRRGNSDLGIWMALTKSHVFRPDRLLVWLWTRRFWGGSGLLAWWHCWRQVLWGRQFTLWIPAPGLCTHLVTGLLTPGIDWTPELGRAAAAAEKLADA